MPNIMVAFFFKSRLLLIDLDLSDEIDPSGHSGEKEHGAFRSD